MDVDRVAEDLEELFRLAPSEAEEVARELADILSRLRDGAHDAP